MPIAGLVLAFAPCDWHRAGRTERSLAAAGLAVDREPAGDSGALAAQLRAGSGPVLIVAAGAWLVARGSIPAIPASATGKPLIGVGAIRQARDEVSAWNVEAAAWSRHLRRCGGDLQRRSWLPRSLPRIAALYLDSASRHALATWLEEGAQLIDAVCRLIRNRDFRAVHLPALDVHSDDALRVLQVVTTIQIGGAERVALDLAEELNRQHVRTAVAALGSATRLAYPQPPCFRDLSTVANHPEARGDAIADAARNFGADLVHAHLLRAADARAIKARGFPLAMTVHNLAPAWPAGLAEAGPDTADFVFACAQKVEAALVEHAPGIPVRTVWNGIYPKPLAPTPERAAAGQAWRAARGWQAGDFVLTAIANPRPQKRLHLLPEIVHALQSLLPDRTVRLVLVGARTGSAETRHAVAAVEAEITRWNVEAQVHWTDGTSDVATILAASTALVSTSAFEGLSLAHLEALAAGLPVVATEVGGTAEIARQSSTLQLVPAAASAATFARRLADLPRSPPTRTPALPPSFIRYHMAGRTRRLYPRVIECARPRESSGEVWLVTNNFSTGGAQMSARRLLLGLAASGVRVRAVTVQEQPDHPTCGRAALLDAGIPVTAIAPPDERDAADGAGQILDLAGRARPRAVLFWNLIVSYKILLADGLTDTPIYDVSPGEMWFTSLAKYFAQPRPGLPYTSPREYGARLAGVVVKYAAEAARAAELGAPVRVIQNGVPIPDSVARSPAGAPLIIGTTARISPDKRLEELIDAVRCAHPRLPPYQLRIAGGIEHGITKYARELRRRARGLPVQWCGEVSEANGFLAGLDLFAMISEPAGCPNASLEAMAASLAVVATDGGGASEQVIDGVTGRLVPRADPEAFADALVDLALDSAHRTACGAAARDHVRAHFSLERMVGNYRALCRSGERFTTLSHEVAPETVAR
ncbi:MAG: hypothetical protein QOE70_5083 [Chthoniobacter sp.]|jgi:glycosyltransferase involved in cell wall biosynthesis|nr:hypothetical protein [Chthoniobacter sp.]